MCICMRFCSRGSFKCICCCFYLCERGNGKCIGVLMHVIAFPTCTAVYLNSDYIFQQCWGLKFEIQQLYHSYEFKEHYVALLF